MAKIGLFVTDPTRGGVLPNQTLDTGEKIIVNHDKSGWLLVERLRVLGFSSERIFAFDLESDEGKTALSFLTRDTQPPSLDTSPLGAFVRYLKTCQSVEDVQRLAAQL